MIEKSLGRDAKPRRTKLVDRRYEPPPQGVGPRPEYLLHLMKTRGANDLIEVDTDDPRI